MSKLSNYGLKLFNLLQNETGWRFENLLFKDNVYKSITLPNARFKLILSRYNVAVISGENWEEDFLNADDHEILYPLVENKITQLDDSCQNACTQAIDEYISQ